MNGEMSLPEFAAARVDDDFIVKAEVEMEKLKMMLVIGLVTWRGTVSLWRRRGGERP